MGWPVRDAAPAAALRQVACRLYQALGMLIRSRYFTSRSLRSGGGAGVAPAAQFVRKRECSSPLGQLHEAAVSRHAAADHACIATTSRASPRPLSPCACLDFIPAPNCLWFRTP